MKNILNLGWKKLPTVAHNLYIYNYIYTTHTRQGVRTVRLFFILRFNYSLSVLTATSLFGRFRSAAYPIIIAYIILLLRVCILSDVYYTPKLKTVYESSSVDLIARRRFRQEWVSNEKNKFFFKKTTFLVRISA